jgi:hypothetical protein
MFKEIEMNLNTASFRLEFKRYYSAKFAVRCKGIRIY